MTQSDLPADSVALPADPDPRSGSTPRRGAVRVATVIASHPVLDAYAGFVPPLLAVLQVRCDLTAWEAASLLSAGSIISGVCQPFFAWLTDRVDSRLLGALGIAVAAAALSCIGLAQSYTTLVVLYGVGMLGVGAYHPVAAASVGQLSGARRSLGVTLFFVAGMVGAAMGPVLSTRLTAVEPNGFELLRWTMIPGLLVAAVLHRAIRNMPHRTHHHRSISFTAAEQRERWTSTLWLTAGNALRYTVYMALLYIYVRWAAALVQDVTPDLAGKPLAKASAILCGELNALTMVGMGVGGLAAGLMVRTGREKWPIVLIPLALAPAIAAFPIAGRLGSYGLAVCAGIGFAAIIPVSISTAQRLLPHRTSLASSLMMGGPWAIAGLGPPLAELCLGARGMAWTFVATAGLLALSGFAGLPLSRGLLERVAREEM